MLLAYKQLVKQIMCNKIFSFLLLLLTALTSLSFFFVIFSIDGNMSKLNEMQTLSENQQLYKNALNANTSLAYTFFASTISLTAFVFVMFFYRFFRSNKKQIGCLKALGFKDRSLRYCFMGFTIIISLIGGVFGLVGGYFLSDVLINANTRNYFMTGLVKNVSLQSILIGLGVSTIIFCITVFFCYSFVRGKESGVLIAGNANNARFSGLLRIANTLSGIIPVKNKFPFRIAFRKPIAILIVLIAVMTFSVFIILGQSTYVSSQKVLYSQTIGHNYEYDTRYSEYQIGPIPDNAIAYIEQSAEVVVGHYETEHTIIGLYNLNHVYQLGNRENVQLSMPKNGSVYINPGLSEIYGVKIGDTFTVYIKGEAYNFIVAEIAVNAKSACVYVNANELAEILGITVGAFNGVMSMGQMRSGISVSKTERIEELNRNARSSDTGAVINQVIGIVSGIVLILMALLITFQDNTRDMLILHMMGYRIKNIRKLLVDVYLPILCVAFFITLAPSIMLAGSIQKSMSLATNEYIPFATNITVILISFIALLIIYGTIQMMFGIGIRRIISKEEMSEFVYAE